MPETVSRFLGRLPTGWRVVPLGDVVAKSRPIVYGIVQAGPHVPDGVPYIRSTDVNGVLRADKLPRTEQAIAGRYKRSSLKPGDIVFSLRGNTGTTCVVPKSLSGANLTQGTARISVSPEFCTSYVRIALNSERVRRRIDAVCKGSTFREITIEDLRKLALPMPPREKQESIAAIVDGWDKAEHGLNGQIKRKHRLLRGLIQQLLTSRRRFSGICREAWKEVLIGDILREADRPVEWNDEAIYDLVSVRSWAGGVYTRNRLAGREIKVKKLKRIKAGDILISHIQSAYGAMAMVSDDHDGHCVSELYTVLIPRDASTFDRRFFAWLCRRKWMWHQAYVASNGFLAERLRISFDPASFLKRAIHIPPTIEEQRAIADVLDTAQKEIDLLRQLRDQIQKQKRGLMQKLLTGQIPVPAVKETKDGSESRAQRVSR
mgnify:FL=1